MKKCILDRIQFGDNISLIFLEKTVNSEVYILNFYILFLSSPKLRNKKDYRDIYRRTQLFKPRNLRLISRL